jgi:hypothetical protein
VSWLPRIYLTTTTICEDEGEFEGPILIFETRRWRIEFSVARLTRQVTK